MRALTFEEAFGFWREHEGSNPHWHDVARERGFDTWEEWRRAYVPAFRMDERAWALYRVVDPLGTVPNWRGGPFQGWIERTYGDAGPSPTFDAIARRLAPLPGGHIEKLQASYPRLTTVLGVVADDGVIIAEGMHRCCAIAALAAKGATLQADVRIALGGWLPGRVPFIPKVSRHATP